MTDLPVQLHIEIKHPYFTDLLLTNRLKKYKNLLHIIRALDMTREGVISSVGRALRLHRRCREFESLITHQHNCKRPQGNLLKNVAKLFMNLNTLIFKVS